MLPANNSYTIQVPGIGFPVFTNIRDALYDLIPLSRRNSRSSAPDLSATGTNSATRVRLPRLAWREAHPLRALPWRVASRSARLGPFALSAHRFMDH